MASYTSVYWLGNEAFREVFEARSKRAALEQFTQLGPNAYDDRRLLEGDVSLAECERLRASDAGRVYQGGDS